MEDKEIIDLFWQRDQEAITRTDEKYGRLCHRISFNILSSIEDSQECVSDTYLAVWNKLPPERPSYFQAFIAAITRNISLKRLRERSTRKRGGVAGDIALDELSECLASDASVEKEYEQQELTEAVNDFLSSLSTDDRDIFICRYWIFMTVAETAKRISCSQSKVSTSLFRTREKLRRFLKEEGLI